VRGLNKQRFIEVAKIEIFEALKFR